MSTNIRLLRRCLLTALIPASCLAWNSNAQAQAWLGDRRYNEGAGVKVGDFELHPGVGAEVGYDSNWFLRSSNSGVSNGNVEAAGILRVTPSLSVSTIGAQRRENSDGTISDPPAVAFRATASATYREFFGPSDISSQRNLSANVDLHLDINPNRPWTFSLTGGYIRTIRPNTLGDPNFSFNTSNIYGGATLMWTPNNGTFDATLGYGLSAMLFEQSAGSPFSNLRHTISFNNKWRFRPRTALFQETSLGIISYNDASAAGNVLTNSMPLRTKIGINGLFAPRIGALASVGYGGGFYDVKATTNQYDSVIAQVEGRFYLTENGGAPEAGKMSVQQSVLAIGYTRDFENSYIGDVVGLNRGYAQLSFFFGGRALLSLSGGASAATYQKIFLTDGSVANQGVTLIRPDAQVFAEYRFTNSFAMNTTLSYAAQLGGSDAVLRYPSQPLPYDLRFSRFQALLGVRLFL